MERAGRVGDVENWYRIWWHSAERVGIQGLVAAADGGVAGNAGVGGLEECGPAGETHSTGQKNRMTAGSDRKELWCTTGSRDRTAHPPW